MRALADTVLVRPNLANLKLNPYIDRDYAEARTEERAIRNATGEYRAIWERQGGCCYYCGDKITTDDERCIVEVNPTKVKRAARSAYVHARCANTLFDYIRASELPASMTDLIDLMARHDAGVPQEGMEYDGLEQFFRMCEAASVTLKLTEIEGLIGHSLPPTSVSAVFWYAEDNPMCDCWLRAGYAIKALNLSGGKIRFKREREGVQRGKLTIPPPLKGDRVPMAAIYEADHFLKGLVKKYGL